MIRYAIAKLPPVSSVKTEKMILDKVEEIPNFLASPEHTPKMTLSSRGRVNGLAPTFIFFISKFSEDI